MSLSNNLTLISDHRQVEKQLTLQATGFKIVGSSPSHSDRFSQRNNAITCIIMLHVAQVTHALSLVL